MKKKNLILKLLQTNRITVEEAEILLEENVPQNTMTNHYLGYLPYFPKNNSTISFNPNQNNF